jgi:hypothetical protein
VSREFDVEPGTILAVLAVVISILSLVAAILTAGRQALLAQRANDASALVELFREYRSQPLASARRDVRDHVKEWEPAKGVEGLPQDVKGLLWFFDNLGVLVAHGVVESGPVIGWLGGSAVVVWDLLEPFIVAERASRSRGLDPNRYQEYFENLVMLIRKTPPEEARGLDKLWRLPRRTRNQEPARSEGQTAPASDDV